MSAIHRFWKDYFFYYFLFYNFSICRFLLYLTIYPPVSQIVKEMRSPSAYSFLFPQWRRRFLLKIGPIKLTFVRSILFKSLLFSPIRSRTASSFTFSDNLIFSVFLQHYISKLSKYFRSKFLSVQASELNNPMFKI